MKKISIIILNYNGWKDTKECINSVQKSKVKSQNWNVLIIDNKSTDDSVERLKRELPKIEIIENDKNLGFAGGVNAGIKKALSEGADYVLLLNNDTLVDKDFISPLIKFAESNPRMGIMAPVISFDLEDKRMHDLGGQINWFIGKATHINSPKNILTEPVERDYVSGCCMLIRKEVFDSIGLFDDKFFLFYEDDDFCIRAKRAGWGVFVVPGITIYHKLSRSAGWFSETSVYHLTRSALIFSGKYLGWRRIFNLLWVIGQSLHFSLKKKEALAITFRAIKDYFTKL